MNTQAPRSLPFMLRGGMAVTPATTAEALTLLAQGTQFLSMRLDHSLKAQRDLLACATPAEVWEVQSAYLQTAIQHYTQATQGMMDLWGHAMTDSMKLPARSYDDVPL